MKKVEADKAELEKLQAETKLLSLDCELEGSLLSSGIFFELPDFILVIVSRFLDAHSLIRLSFTSKNLRNLIMTDTNRTIFKPFCLALYKDLPSLPFFSVFENLRDIVNKSPSQFNPNLRLRINADPRQIAWGNYYENQKVDELYRTPKAFYKQFGSYTRMFMEAPRVHFGGYYACKERYVKYGEKAMSAEYLPLIEVTYYRYFRFFPDGRFSFLLSNKKLGKDVITKQLDEQLTQIHDNGDDEYRVQEHGGKSTSRFGEFILKEDKVYLRFNSGLTIFEFVLHIASSSYGAHDTLLVTSHMMHELQIDHSYTIYQADHPQDSTKRFKFKRLIEFKEGQLTQDETHSNTLRMAF